MFLQSVTQAYTCEYDSKYVQVNHLSLSKRDICLQRFYIHDSIENLLNFGNYSVFDTFRARISTIAATLRKRNHSSRINGLYYHQTIVYRHVSYSDKCFILIMIMIEKILNMMYVDHQNANVRILLRLHMDYQSTNDSESWLFCQCDSTLSKKTEDEPKQQIV